MVDGHCAGHSIRESGPFCYTNGYGGLELKRVVAFFFVFFFFGGVGGGGGGRWG